MNLLNKLTIKNLKMNRKRTIVTIIGIMLSVALITAVATMYASLIKSIIKYETYEKGDFHVVYYDVPIKEVTDIKNTRGIEAIYLTKDIGYAKLENSKNEYKPYIFIKGFAKDSLDELSIKLVEGRFPENENEILIPTHLKTNGRVVMHTGETITLNIGKRINKNEKYELNQSDPISGIEEDIVETIERTYKIVGIIERPASNIEDYHAPGYTFITYMDTQKMNDKVNVYAKYTKKGSKDYLKLTSTILGINEKILTKMYKAKPNELSEEEYNEATEEIKKSKYRFNINTYLITLENNPLEDSSGIELGIVVIIVIIIIIVASVFCIRNSFNISITEKIKQYGMLRSIGATKKQIRKNVFYEATILGIIGIPLGLVAGFIASYILVIISNIFIKGAFAEGLSLVLSYSWKSYGIAIILGIVTIYFSALKSARKAAKVSPIESIRNSGNIKIKAKKIKSPKIIRKIFKIGGEISYKNLKRNKKKYRTTIISIVVSISIFIALSFFIESAFSVVENELKISDYNMVLSSYKNTKEIAEKLYETIKLDNIEDCAIYRYSSIAIKNPKYNKEYLDLSMLESDYSNKEASFTIMTIGDYQYRKYLKKLNLDYNEFQNKGILIDNETIHYNNDKGKNTKKTIRKFLYQDKDIIEISNTEKNTKIEIGCVTQEIPFGFGYGSQGLIVSDELFNKFVPDCYNIINISYKSNNCSKLQDDIENLLGEQEYNLNNKEENAKMMQNLYTLIAIFLYGFIIVITLIGITNIFNTITTNMNLRSQEFAMLKSIGMTKKEFNNMIRLESIFIGAKALIIGIPIGIGLSYMMYKALEMDMDGWLFKPPILAIVICIVAVYLLITILMKYSMKKINKQNTIETIRNENI